MGTGIRRRPHHLARAAPPAHTSFLLSPSGLWPLAPDLLALILCTVKLQYASCQHFAEIRSAPLPSTACATRTTCPSTCVRTGCTSTSTPASGWGWGRGVGVGGRAGTRQGHVWAGAT